MMISSRVAVIGAGVSGLTCAKLLAESGYDVTIFAAESGERTTSSAAAAIWYLYDVSENDLVVDWAFATHDRLRELARDPESGVSMIEFRCYGIEAPAWTSACEYREIDRGFSVRVPLMDTQRYLDYLRRHVTIRVVPPFASLDEVPREFDVIVNCTGYGARSLVRDDAVHAHRGQVVIIDRIDQSFAFVREDNLTYIIPRTTDCILGGTSTESISLDADADDTAGIRERCSEVIDLSNHPTRAVKVGLRPVRNGGVRVEKETLRDGRVVVHNYGHGGSGFTLSWGCAEAVLGILLENSNAGGLHGNAFHGNN